MNFESADSPSAFFSAFPLVGSAVRLEPFGPDHLTCRYVAWLNDPEVVKYSDQRFRKHTVQSCESFAQSMARAGNLFIAIHLLEDGRHIGNMSATFDRKHGSADLAILIGDRSCWGKGIGLDAWSTLMGALLSRPGIRKVTGGAIECNLGMIRIMERAGMTPDGRRFRHQLVAGTPYDVVHFARFADER